MSPLKPDPFPYQASWSSPQSVSLPHLELPPEPKAPVVSAHTPLLCSHPSAPWHPVPAAMTTHGPTTLHPRSHPFPSSFSAASDEHPLPSPTHSPPRSPWLSLFFTSPIRSKFPTIGLPNTLTRLSTKPDLARSSQSYHPNSSPTFSHYPSGEDLDNFVWDVDYPSGSSRTSNDTEELHQIARLYDPAIAQRPRPSSRPHHLRGGPSFSIPTSPPEGETRAKNPTPSLFSSNSLRSSIAKLLRKGAARHRTNRSQSSISRASTHPSENLDGTNHATPIAESKENQRTYLDASDPLQSTSRSLTRHGSTDFNPYHFHRSPACTSHPYLTFSSTPCLHSSPPHADIPRALYHHC